MQVYENLCCEEVKFTDICTTRDKEIQLLIFKSCLHMDEQKRN